MPDIETKFSLNNATMVIKNLQTNTPPNVTVTFCVDMSYSMQPEERAGAVKKALIDVLDNAQQEVNKSTEAQISIAFIRFRSKLIEITDPIALTHNDNSKSEKIKKKVEDLEFDGYTQILVGFEGAATESEKLARANPLAHHYVLFLTDGKLENNERWNNQKLFSIQNRLTAISAKVFAIGIGKEHSGAILREIATNNGFNGTYINTTVDKDSIKNTIAAIYKQAISSFQDLELSSSLPAGTWSADHSLSVGGNEQSKVPLGSLAEGKTLTKQIVIHGHKLPDDLDLSTVFFNFTCTDPKGRKGRRKIHWETSPKVVSAIEKACLPYRK
jgi:Mg-chelatase subunit ChlD